MDVRDDLLGLAASVEENWEPRHFCVQLCLADYLYDNRFETDGIEPHLEALAEAMGFDSYVDIYFWNDEPGRTKEQVLDRIHVALKGLQP